MTFRLVITFSHIDYKLINFLLIANDCVNYLPVFELFITTYLLTIINHKKWAVFDNEASSVRKIACRMAIIQTRHLIQNANTSTLSNIPTELRI